MPTAPALAVRLRSDEVAVRELLAAELDGTGAVAIDDANDLEWRIFFQTREARDGARQTLEPFARAHQLTIGSIDVEDEDWARRSQAALTAVRIGHIVVAPPWDIPAARGPRHEAPPEARSTRHGPRPDARGTRPDMLIVIEPSLGFGTGHHASTRLCLRAMQQLDLRGKSVIDVGTGSGVLAIAAVRLGAAHVTAIDTDTDAVASARENGARNQVVVDWHVADVAAADTLCLRDRRPALFDVVLANLTGAWLRRLSAPLRELTASGGTYVLAGLQTSERDRVLEAFLPSSRLHRELDEEGWSALVLTTPHP